MFDDETLVLEDAHEPVPHAYQYRALFEWAGEWTQDSQPTLQETTQHVSKTEDAACAYREFNLSPSVAIEP